MAQMRANRAAALARREAASTATSAVDINNTNAGRASCSEIETPSPSTSGGSWSRIPPTLSPSPSQVIDGAVSAPAASVASTQTVASGSEVHHVDLVLPTRPAARSVILANLFDDDEDVDIVNVETSTEASSPPINKRKATMFGEDDSEGESDFENHQPAKKSKPSGVAAAASSKRERQEDATRLYTPAKPKSASMTIVKHASALQNGKAGCYQNTVLHLLSGIPAFAAMGTEETFGSARAGIALAFSEMMSKMLNNPSSKSVDTRFFQKACGEILGSKFNGKTQEDADEFLCTLVERLQKERPDLGLAAQLEAPIFVRKAPCCKCSTVREIVESSPMLMPAMNAPRPVSFGDLWKKYAQDTSDFGSRPCLTCDALGNYKRQARAARSTMRNSPSFLKFMISRVDLKGGEAKNRTKITLPQDCSFLNESGKTVKYVLVAAAGHNGRTMLCGHWMALRKIGNEWFQCDSAGEAFGGVKKLAEADFDKHTHVGMCLFKKIE